jgi:hypothetical protein
MSHALEKGKCILVGTLQKGIDFVDNQEQMILYVWL